MENMIVHFQKVEIYNSSMWGDKFAVATSVRKLHIWLLVQFEHLDVWKFSYSSEILHQNT